MHYKEKFQVIIWIIVGVTIVGTYFNWSSSLTSNITIWLISIGVGIIISGITGELIEKLGGSFLKTISIPVQIGPVSFSVSLFVITTFILKKILFPTLD